MILLLAAVGILLVGLGMLSMGLWDALHSANFTPWYGPAVCEATFGVMVCMWAVALFIAAAKDAQ